eukprot:7382120-Prymnesium_polylepis.4
MSPSRKRPHQSASGAKLAKTLHCARRLTTRPPASSAVRTATSNMTRRASRSPSCSCARARPRRNDRLGERRDAPRPSRDRDRAPVERLPPRRPRWMRERRPTARCGPRAGPRCSRGCTAAADGTTCP